ncbi:MAG: hypothetical protein JWP95_845 [Actinotalea sp.]|nr:hypothetical protein [Actinotalea sp.]
MQHEKTATASPTLTTTGAPPSARRTPFLDRPAALARLAGVLYLALAALGGWAELAVRGTVHVPGDAAATAANIVVHETLFRLGLGADILMATVFVLLGLALFRLLHGTHPRGATALLVLVGVGAGSILVNLTFHVGALLAATDPAYTSALGPGTADTLALLLLDLHHHGYVLGGVLFGLWLLPMGWVAYRSPMFPRVLGVALVLGAAAWVADPMIAFTMPGAPVALRSIVSVPTSVAEFGLMLYLLVRGVRPAARAASATSLRPRSAGIPARR